MKAFVIALSLCYSASLFGQATCSAPPSKLVFDAVFNYISYYVEEGDRDKLIRQFTDENCPTSQHIYELAAIYKTEVAQWNYIEYAYNHAYDAENYTLVRPLFKTPSYQEALDKLIINNINNNTNTNVNNNNNNVTVIVNGSTPPPPPVVVVEAEPPYEPIPGYTGTVGCEYPLDDNTYTQVLRSISSKDFEDTKLKIAKQITASNCLTTDQVVGIVEQFDFEGTRLEYAKFAYDYTYDLTNYFKLNDVFSFESSVDKLTDYIQEK